MEVQRIHIHSWTASFRYPRFMVGMQPSFKVPPLSTIYGLLSAIAGKQITPKDVCMGYIFQNRASYIDLELIYELQSLKIAKSNIIRRENLFDCHLYLYIKYDDNKAFNFRTPYFPLLLGRSTDLATVVNIKKMELIQEKNVRLGFTIVPYDDNLVKGIIQALPVYMTRDIPRKAIGVRPFIMLENWQIYPEKIWYDSEMDFGVWMHNSKSLELESKQ